MRMTISVIFCIKRFRGMEYLLPLHIIIKTILEILLNLKFNLFCFLKQYQVAKDKNVPYNLFHPGLRVKFVYQRPCAEFQKLALSEKLLFLCPAVMFLIVVLGGVGTFFPRRLCILNMYRSVSHNATNKKQ